jgi:hypothetical protein
LEKKGEYSLGVDFEFVKYLEDAGQDWLNFGQSLCTVDLDSAAKAAGFGVLLQTQRI